MAGPPGATVAAVPAPDPPIDWAAIYATYSKSIRTVAIAAIGGENKAIFGRSADDIVGDIIAAMMRKGIDPTQKDDPAGYLKAAVRNRIRDLHKRTKFQDDDEIDFDTLVRDVDVEAEAERNLLAEAAVAGAADLPDNERYVIAENVMKGRHLKDVGPEIGVTGQRAGQLLKRALGRLRALPAFTDAGSVDQATPGPSTTTGPEATGTPS